MMLLFDEVVLVLLGVVVLLYCRAGVDRLHRADGVR